MDFATYVVYVHGFEGKSPFKHFMIRTDAERFARSTVNDGLATGAYLYEVAGISNARLAVEAVRERRATLLRPFTKVASKEELKRKEQEDARRLLTELGLL
jgi:hypothetical protein